MNLPPRLALFLVCALARPAAAYESQCRPGTTATSFIRDVLERSVCLPASEPECKPGLEFARGRQLGEHTWIAREAMVRAGLPTALVTREDALSYYIDGAPVGPQQCSNNPRPESIAPAAPGAMRKRVVRRLAIAELAQAVDGSFSLGDFLLGNEHCLAKNAIPNAMLDDVDQINVCHTFESHLSTVNSTHFLPQAREMYLRYHRYAIEVATACKKMCSAFQGRPCDGMKTLPNHALAVRMKRMVEDCEKEALVLEATANHFLGDAWSSGHMWQRWGSPRFAPLDDTSERLRRATVSLVAGLIHGWRSKVRPLADKVFQHDQMCLPGKVPGLLTVVPVLGQLLDKLISLFDDVVMWSQPGGEPREGAGDLYLLQCNAVDRKAEGALVSGPSLRPQLRRMLTCGAAGFREVYEKGPGVAGALGARVDWDDAATESSGDGCWSQRATNASMSLGLGAWSVSFGGFNPLKMLASRLVIGAVPFLSQGHDAWLPEKLLVGSVSLQAELTRLSYEVSARAAEAPEGRDLADLDAPGLRSLLGVSRNAEHVGELDTLEYLEPKERSAWRIANTNANTPCTSDAQCRALPGAYCDRQGSGATANAAGRCVALEASIVRAFRLAEVAALCAAEGRAEQDAARRNCKEHGGAACDACVDVLAPHLRNACGPGSFSERDATGVDRRSLCDILAQAGLARGSASPLFSAFDAAHRGDDAHESAAEAAARALCLAGPGGGDNTNYVYDYQEGPPPARDIHATGGFFANQLLCAALAPGTAWMHRRHGADSVGAHLHRFQFDVTTFIDFPYVVPADRVSVLVWRGAGACAAANNQSLAGATELVPFDLDGDGVKDTFRYEWLVPARTADELCFRVSGKDPAVHTGYRYREAGWEHCAGCDNPCRSCVYRGDGDFECRDLCANVTCNDEPATCEGNQLARRPTTCVCGACEPRRELTDCGAERRCEPTDGGARCVDVSPSCP